MRLHPLPISLVLLMLFTKCALAESLNFEQIKVPELTKLVYTQILEQGYLADSDFEANNDTVTVMVKDMSKPQLNRFLKSMLNSAGFDVVNVDGYVKIKKLETKPVQLETFFYKPKYRDVTYITDLVSKLFKTGAFTFQRSVANQPDTAGQSSGQTVPSSQTTQTATSTAPVDSGTSAYSLQNKPKDAFIFNGTRAEVDTLKTMLEKIDIADTQVAVKAYVFEVTNTDSNATSLSLTADLLGTVLKADIAANALSNVLTVKGLGINAVFSALKTDSRFKVVSSPFLRVKNNEIADFNIGSEVPVLGAIVTQQGGAVQQSVEYKTSGVLLKIQPKIFADTVQVKIQQQISSFVLTNTGVNNSPTLNKREISTVVDFADDEVMILGGLDENQTTDAKSGIPWLPFLGSKSTDKRQSNVLLILQVTRI